MIMQGDFSKGWLKKKNIADIPTMIQQSERLQIAHSRWVAVCTGQPQHTQSGGREGVQDTQKQLTRRCSKPDALVVYRHRQKKGKNGNLTWYHRSKEGTWAEKNSSSWKNSWYNEDMEGEIGLRDSFGASGQMKSLWGEQCLGKTMPIAYTKHY